MLLRPPRPATSPLFPYTTLFRSRGANYTIARPFLSDAVRHLNQAASQGRALAETTRERFSNISRSEEHTSELQSHVNLVCRLLLEKKNVYTHESSLTD